MNIDFKPLNGYVTVKPDTISVSTETTGFNIRSTETDPKAGIGQVVFKGVNETKVSIGDKIIYHAYPAIKQVVGSDIYYFVKETDIISIIK